ncbi:unnamed protein product [Blepharisma stoltei]|uniref:protein-tyrosine-phosphatase n=1 Tax=Blepharisma stoltei TaxID=1481888 RepID=A0AAU9JKN9_9CILI|nr:unnamed protein product [Blepharisma stoltei]
MKIHQQPETNLRQQKLEEFFHQEKPAKSEASILPKIRCSSNPDINYISPQSLADLLDNKISIEKYLVIDARYPYEYEGGHIQSAVNISSPENLSSILEGSNWENTPIIIHCEFSQQRGPALYRWLRNSDRLQNMENYPALSYPELYILQGGYSEFFKLFENFCTPQSYVTMKDPLHKHDRKKLKSKTCQPRKAYLRCS